MKKILLTILMFGFVSSQNLYSAPDDKFGVGFMIGDPTGFSFKKWKNDEQAFDAGLSWNIGKNERFRFHGTYLMHNYNIFEGANVSGKLPVYFGVGARVIFRDNDYRNDDDEKEELSLGIRVPVGISYITENENADLFAEIVPTMGVVPGSSFDFDAAIGARYYF